MSLRTRLPSALVAALAIGCLLSCDRRAPSPNAGSPAPAGPSARAPEPDRSPVAPEVAKALEFVSTVPRLRPLPVSLESQWAGWLKRIAVLRKGMARAETMSVLEAAGVPFHPSHEEGMVALEECPLDGDWWLAVAWSDIGTKPPPTLAGWRLYGPIEDFAAAEEGDIELMRTISRFPGYFAGSQYDPIWVIRLCNECIRAGEAKFVQAIESFFRMRGKHLHFEYFHAVSIALRCLFVSDPEHPAERVTLFVDDDEVGFLKSHPVLPLVFYDDVPFWIAAKNALWGVWGPPVEADLKWAKEHGKFRTELLRPKQAPFKIAQQLIEELSKCGLKEKFEDDVWQQAAAAAGFPKEERWKIASEAVRPDETVSSRMKEFRREDITWDPELERFRKP